MPVRKFVLSSIVATAVKSSSSSRYRGRVLGVESRLRRERLRSWTSGMGSSFSSSDQHGAPGIVRAQNRSDVLNAQLQGPAGQIWMVVGLGNPGPRYAGNRHNVGFMAVDTLAKQLGVIVNKLQHNAAISRSSLQDKRIVLAKPMTFMNASGEAIGKLARFYKVRVFTAPVLVYSLPRQKALNLQIPPEKIIVVYDDLDIPTATVRLRGKGGHGGHNGIKSLSQHISGDFPRVRIGVGRPSGQRSVIDHVLQDFSTKEKVEIDIAIQEAIDAVKAVVELGLEKALSGKRL